MKLMIYNLIFNNYCIIIIFKTNVLCLTKKKTKKKPKMYLKLTILLVISLCASSLKVLTAKVISNTNIANSSTYQRATQNGSLNDEPKFSDLNEDVLSLILENLNFMGLFNLIEATPWISPLALRVFYRKHYEIEIHRADANGRHSDRMKLNEIPSKRIEINNFELISSVIKRFGHVIQRLNIRNDLIEPHHSAVISRIINEYCSETLKYLKLGSVKDDTFEHFVAPFNSIEDLSFDVVSNGTKFGPLPLDRLFPNLRNMTIFMQTNTNYSFIDCTFAQLNHLNLIVTNDALERRDQIDGLIKRNPQVKSIELNFFRTITLKPLLRFCQMFNI